MTDKRYIYIYILAVEIVYCISSHSAPSAKVNRATESPPFLLPPVVSKRIVERPSFSATKNDVKPSVLEFETSRPTCRIIFLTGEMFPSLSYFRRITARFKPMDIAPRPFVTNVASVFFDGEIHQRDRPICFSTSRGLQSSFCDPSHRYSRLDFLTSLFSSRVKVV